MEVGKAIRRVRHDFDMTLAEFADMIGSGASLVGSWERGERLIQLNDLVRLCYVTNVPVEELMPRTQPPDSSVWRIQRVVVTNGSETWMGATPMWRTQ